MTRIAVIGIDSCVLRVVHGIQLLSHSSTWLRVISMKRIKTIGLHVSAVISNLLLPNFSQERFTGLTYDRDLQTYFFN